MNGFPDAIKRAAADALPSRGPRPKPRIGHDDTEDLVHDVGGRQTFPGMLMRRLVRRVRDPQRIKADSSKLKAEAAKGGY